MVGCNGNEIYKHLYNKRQFWRREMVDKIKNNNNHVLLKVMAFVITAIIVVLMLWWNKYLNKHSLLEKFITQEQEVYLLGTLHKEHFDKWINYSMEDILNVIENLQPDVVFIEAREECFIDYGVIDGPIDMVVVYSYCIDKDIPIEMVDWWVVDNSFKENSTNDKRDDMIFGNIADKLTTVDEGSKVLIICGAGHFYEQSRRFMNNGFRNQEIGNKSVYFDNSDKGFQYPTTVEDVWKQRAFFYAYTLPEIISQDITLNNDIKAGFTERNHDEVYNKQLEYLDYFSKNKLYK